MLKRFNFSKITSTILLAAFLLNPLLISAQIHNPELIANLEADILAYARQIESALKAGIDPKGIEELADAWLKANEKLLKQVTPSGKAGVLGRTNLTGLDPDLMKMLKLASKNSRWAGQYAEELSRLLASRNIKEIELLKELDPKLLSPAQKSALREAERAAAAAAKTPLPTAPKIIPEPLTTSPRLIGEARIESMEEILKRMKDAVQSGKADKVKSALGELKAWATAESPLAVGAREILEAAAKKGIPGAAAAVTVTQAALLAEAGFANAARIAATEAGVAARDKLMKDLIAKYGKEEAERQFARLLKTAQDRLIKEALGEAGEEALRTASKEGREELLELAGRRLGAKLGQETAEELAKKVAASIARQAVIKVLGKILIVLGIVEAVVDVARILDGSWKTNVAQAEEYETLIAASLRDSISSDNFLLEKAMNTLERRKVAGEPYDDVFELIIKLLNDLDADEAALDALLGAEQFKQSQSGTFGEDEKGPLRKSIRDRIEEVFQDEEEDKKLKVVTVKAGAKGLSAVATLEGSMFRDGEDLGNSATVNLGPNESVSLVVLMSLVNPFVLLTLNDGRIFGVNTDVAKPKKVRAAGRITATTGKTKRPTPSRTPFGPTIREDYEPPAKYPSIFEDRQPTPTIFTPTPGRGSIPTRVY